MDINSLAHTKWNCKYHIVFAPKYRRKIIYGQLKRDIANILSMLCKRKGVKIVEAEVCPNHIHMLVEIPPSISVSSFVGYLKGKSDILLCSSSRIEENSPCKSNRVEIAKVEDAIMKIVNMYATAYLDEKGIKKAGKSKEVSPEKKIATLEKKVKSLSSKKMMLYSDYKDDKLTREEYVKRSNAMVEQIDELHQEIEQLKIEIPPEENSSSKFETQLESIINMESFDREKIQKVIKKVIINGEDNIEIVWNTDDPFFK